MLLKKAFLCLFMRQCLYLFGITFFNLLFILLIGCLHQFFPTKHCLSCFITLALLMAQFMFLVVLVFLFFSPIIKVSSNFTILNVSSLGLTFIISVTSAFKRTLVVFTSFAMLCSMSCLFLFILLLPLLLLPLQLTNLFFSFSLPLASFSLSPSSSLPFFLPHSAFHSPLLSALPHKTLKP